MPSVGRVEPPRRPHAAGLCLHGIVALATLLPVECKRKLQRLPRCILLHACKPIGIRCRNRCLAAVERVVEEEDWLDDPSLVALDFDLERGFRPAAVASSLKLLTDDVACVAANGVCTPRGHTYDAFALRLEAFETGPLPYNPLVFGTLESGPAWEYPLTNPVEEFSSPKGATGPL